MRAEHRPAEAPPAEARRPDRAYDLPDPTLGTGVQRFIAGVKCAFSGFAFTLRHGRVLAWCAGAVGLYLLLWGLILWLAAAWDQSFVTSLLWLRGPSWWESALWQMARFGLYLLFWIAAVLLAFVIALPLMAPVFTLLAEVVEQAFYGDAARLETSWAELAREMAVSLTRSAALSMFNLAGAAAIWAIGLAAGLVFPPLGTALGVVFGGGWAAMWLAIIGMSYVLENNRTPLAEQLRLPGRNLPLLLGFGTVAQVMAWLPLTVPLIVVSATVLCCRLGRHGHVGLSVRAQWEQRRAGDLAAGAGA